MSDDRRQLDPRHTITASANRRATGDYQEIVRQRDASIAGSDRWAIFEAARLLALLAIHQAEDH